MEKKEEKPVLEMVKLLRTCSGEEYWALGLVLEELRRARETHPKFNSAHEGLAVIYEEFDELKLEVWKRNTDILNMRLETVQLAAMAVRFLLEAT